MILAPRGPRRVYERLDHARDRYSQEGSNEAKHLGAREEYENRNDRMNVD
jgi:hypothetical protein